jgi:two-component system chemotaxis response regulator CheY
VRLLIAHGSQTAQEALAAAIQRADEPLEIVTVSEGSEALEILLQDDPPEVALIDWDLPSIEGPEMCRLVRDFHHGHDTWIVVLAGSRHEDTADAWRAGAGSCVSTPAPPSALRACVDEGLRKMRPPQAGAMAADPRSGAVDAASGDGDWTFDDVDPLPDFEIPALDATVQADDLGERAFDAGPATLDAGPATLDAVRMPEGAGEFYGFAGTELRATAGPERGFEPTRSAARRETDELRGAALLQVVLGER